MLNHAKLESNNVRLPKSAVTAFPSQLKANYDNPKTKRSPIAILQTKTVNILAINQFSTPDDSSCTVESDRVRWRPDLSRVLPTDRQMLTSALTASEVWLSGVHPANVLNYMTSAMYIDVQTRKMVSIDSLEGNICLCIRHCSDRFVTTWYTSLS